MDAQHPHEELYRHLPHSAHLALLFSLMPLALSYSGYFFLSRLKKRKTSSQ